MRGCKCLKNLSLERWMDWKIISISRSFSNKQILCHCFKGNLRVSTQKVLGVTTLPSFPGEMGTQRSQCSGSMVQTSNITFQSEVHFKLCN